ncbi:IS21-like element helper ATPase IstB [Clostridia bacterium OttesenSCG-928-O13]|nr:IS21-like element helper ATPase IstB [Clostridia bacterium OttesenSCG-928-O13]
MKQLDQIHTYAKQLGLSNLANHTFELLPEAISNEDFLIRCLKDELAYREDRAKQRRVKQAQLPTTKTFESFDSTFQNGITDWQLRQLAALNWIDGIFNVIFIGPPGTGKTHLALAVGNKALENGYKVFFASMDTLVHILKTQEISRNSAARLKWIRECHLLIIDELGYLPVSKIEANLFFQLISNLYENTSVVITSNKGFDGWADIIGDPVLTTALLDRLTHRCQVLSFSGEGWRVAHREVIFEDTEPQKN